MKKKSLAIMLTVFIIVGVVTSLYRIGYLFSNKEELKLSAIEDKLKAGNIDGAYSDIDKYTTENPDSSEGWLVYSKVAIESGDILLSIETAEKSFSLDNDSYKALNNLGFTSRILQEYEDAEFYYKKAIELKDDFADSYNGLAVVYLLTGDYEAAIENGLKAFDLEGDNASYAANLAIIYHFAENSEKRDEYYKKANDLNYSEIETLDDIFILKLTLEDKYTEDYSIIEEELERLQNEADSIIENSNELLDEVSETSSSSGT